VVFLNGTMLSLSDKSDSVNKCTQEISELMKLLTLGVWQNAYKFNRQLAHCHIYINAERLDKGKHM